MSRRALGVGPAAWTSKRPASIAPAFSSTSGGWITGPAFVSAASSTSAHGRTAGNSSANRASAASRCEAGKTPTGRVAARTGAATTAGPVFRATYGPRPVSPRACGRAPPARAISRARTQLPSVPGVSSTVW